LDVFLQEKKAEGLREQAYLYVHDKAEHPLLRSNLQ
jgi:hypothetical protein